MRWLLLLCLGGCIDYEALTNGRRDLSVDLGGEDASEDLSLIPPDLAEVDLAGADLTDPAAPQLIGKKTLVMLGAKTNSQTPPAGTTLGDLVLLVTWWSDSTSAPSLTGEAFQVLDTAQQAGVQTARWFWRIVDDPNEATVSYTLTFANTIDSAMMVITFRGASTAVSTGAMARITSDWPIAVTTTVANTAVVPSLAYAQNAGTWTPPLGFSLIGGTLRVVSFLAAVAVPQIVSIAMPQSVTNVTPLLTDVVLVQP